MKTKICSKCKKEKPLSEFYKDRRSKNSVCSICKLCIKLRNTEHYKNNKNKILKLRNTHYKQNKNKLIKYQIVYRKKNKRKITERRKIYDQKNKKQISNSAKMYRKANKESISKCEKKYKQTIAKFSVYAVQLYWAEKVNKKFNGELLVCCAYCGKTYTPTVSETQSRVKALNGKGTGECRFYCSKSCKQTCPTYRQRTLWKGQNDEDEKRLGTSREVDAWFRQFVLETDNWTCQKCRVSKDEDSELVLHVHHLKGVAQHPMLQNDIDNAITLCKKCHKELHKKQGCNYFDYRRKRCGQAA